MEVTAEMLSGLTDSVFTNMAVVVPVGCTIMAAIVGVKMIPRIISWFTRA